MTPLDRAAQWQKAGQQQGRAGGAILIILPRTSRIVEIGAVPSFEAICRSELGKRGIAADDVESVPAGAHNPWEEARALGDWLKRHDSKDSAQATVSLACSPFATGRLRYIFNNVLGPGDAERVRLVSLPDPACPLESWWRTRRGVKEFMYAWLELLYTWGRGEQVPVPQSTAAIFQSEVRAAIGEAPR